MKGIFISVAAIALLAAAPSFAQQERHHEQGSRGGSGPHAMSPGHPDRNPGHGTPGGMRGPNPTHNPTPQAAPQAAPQSNAAMMRRGERNDNDHRGGNAGNTHRDNNRDARDNNRDARDNNRFEHRGGSMAGPDHRMMGPTHRDRNMGHDRPRVRNFNSYHRNFRSARRYHGRPYHRPRGWYAHRWTFGERLPPAFFVRDYWINDYFDFGLVPPPFGTVWVRYGDDALLIDETTGEVIQVAYSVFY